MKDQSKVSQPQKETQENKGRENGRSSEAIKYFTPPPGILPVEIQPKPNIIQKMQALPMNERPAYFQPNIIQRMQNMAEEDRPEKLQPNIIQKMQRKKAEEGQALQLKHESGNKMPEHVQSKMEGSMGADFSNVNIHEGDNASSVGALAYTQGNNIHFAPGQFNPESQKGQELLGHELAHVVQQREGRVKATTQAKGLSVNDEPELEKEADEMGTKAAQFKKDENALPPSGNESIHSEVIQKATEIPTDYKSDSQMLAMNCFELDAYANIQADWHSNPTLTDTARNLFRTVLSFLRTGSNLAPCGNMAVKDFIDHINLFGETYVKTNLSAYCKAVSESVPFEYATKKNPVSASWFGAIAIKLKANFPAYVLASAFKEDEITQIDTKGWINDLIAYYTTSKPTPIFQAEDAADLVAYYNMKTYDNVDPLNYNTAPLKDNIRNFHRFEKDALDTLKVNFNDVSKTKPLTLILHTAVDHNGAFHRDPELTKVIKNPKINALLIEGKETLDEVKSEITPMAIKYGINNKLDQVMFAGHGNVRTIELAGTIKNGGGKIKEVGDAVDLDRTDTKSDELLDEVLKNVDDASTSAADKQKHRNIIFNGCLTNSNQVNSSSAKGLTSQDDIKKAFLADIKAHGSLTNHMKEKAAAKSKDTKVKGGNASFGSIKLINNATGDLDLVSSIDPKLTSSKLEYMEFGIEPLGTLRAAVECWATDEKSCFEAMARRATKKSAQWDNIIITKSYEIILSKYKSDGVAINEFTDHANTLGEGTQEGHCSPQYFSSLDYAGVDMLEIFKALSGSTQFATLKYLPLVMYQNWMTLDSADAALKTTFLNYLETNYTCHSAQRFVDIEYLSKKGHLKNLLSGPASTGKLILALLGVAQSNQADCKAYVVSQVNSGNTFDAALDVNKLLGGLSTDTEILIKIGKKTAPTSTSTSSTTSTAPQNANLVPVGETKNMIYVDSVTKKGKIKSTPEAEIYKLPYIPCAKMDVIAKDTDVFIIGSADSFWAIEYKTKDATPKPGTAFVYKTDISIV